MLRLTTVIGIRPSAGWPLTYDEVNRKVLSMHALEQYSRSAQFQLCRTFSDFQSWSPTSKLLWIDAWSTDQAEMSATGVSRSVVYFGAWSTVTLWTSNKVCTWSWQWLAGSVIPRQLVSHGRPVGLRFLLPRWELSAVAPRSSSVERRGWRYSNQVVKAREWNLVWLWVWRHDRVVDRQTE